MMATDDHTINASGITSSTTDDRSIISSIGVQLQYTIPFNHDTNPTDSDLCHGTSTNNNINTPTIKVFHIDANACDAPARMGLPPSTSYTTNHNHPIHKVRRFVIRLV
jgi:hypothetical protein